MHLRSSKLHLSLSKRHLSSSPLHLDCILVASKLHISCILVHLSSIYIHLRGIYINLNCNFSVSLAILQPQLVLVPWRRFEKGNCGNFNCLQNVSANALNFFPCLYDIYMQACTICVCSFVFCFIVISTNVPVLSWRRNPEMIRDWKTFGAFQKKMFGNIYCVYLLAVTANI